MASRYGGVAHILRKLSRTVTRFDPQTSGLDAMLTARCILRNNNHYQVYLLFHLHSYLFCIAWYTTRRMLQPSCRHRTILYDPAVKLLTFQGRATFWVPHVRKSGFQNNAFSLKLPKCSAAKVFFSCVLNHRYEAVWGIENKTPRILDLGVRLSG
jgi:hypothetical protein